MSPESLPVRLRQARGVMSLSEAAALVGIPEDRIRMYEEGVRRPYGKTLRRLADVYGVRVAELLGSGNAVRPARRRPAVRRRRRVEAVAAVAGNGVVSVPVEVTEGQTIRLVIELVVKPRAEVAPAPAPAEPEEVEAARSAPVVEVPPTAGLAASGAGDSITLPQPFAARRRPDGVAGEPMDPILELKRAYRDFRHKKR